MKTLALTAAIALGITGCGAPAAPPAEAPEPPVAAAPDRCLSLVGWNDLHGQLAPDHPVIGTGPVPAGGVVALADRIAAIRETGDDVVLVEAGDLFTGPLESVLSEGAPIIDAYRVIGVDAAALGNHDFDFGPVGKAVLARPGLGDEAGAEGPRGALFERMKTASFPFLSANVHRKGGAAVGWPNFAAATTVKRGAWNVGVVGYTTEETPHVTLRPNVADLDFSKGAAQAVGASIRELRASGASPVVLVAHASLEGTLPQALDDHAPHEGEMARLLEALGPDLPDLVVAGHRHAWLLGRVRGVPIVSSDQHGIGLSRSRFCREGGAAKLVSIDREVALASSPPASELGKKVAAVIAPWQEKVRAEAERVVVTLPRACPPHAHNGNAYGEQVARATALTAHLAAPIPKGVPVVGMTNSGALRAPLPAGPVRFADVFAAFPFANAVSVCGTTKGGLARILRTSFTKPASKDRFPLGLSGATVRVKRKPSGELELLGLEVEGLPKTAGDDAPVFVATSDFVLWGGDGLLEGVKCDPSASSTLGIRDAWLELLAKEKGGCDGPAKSVIVE